MPNRKDSDSRRLLRRLRDTLAAPGASQDRLDQITHHIADSMGTEVCSIYLFRDADTLELSATEGLKAAAVHKTRLRLGEGLVGRVARTGRHRLPGPALAEQLGGLRASHDDKGDPLLMGLQQFARRAT